MKTLKELEDIIVSAIFETCGVKITDYTKNLMIALF